MEREIVLVFLIALRTMTVETEAEKSFVAANLGLIECFERKIQDGIGFVLGEAEVESTEKRSR